MDDEGRGESTVMAGWSGDVVKRRSDEEKNRRGGDVMRQGKWLCCGDEEKW